MNIPEKKKKYESYLPSTYDWAADITSRKSGVHTWKCWRRKAAGTMQWLQRHGTPYTHTRLKRRGRWHTGREISSSARPTAQEGDKWRCNATGNSCLQPVVKRAHQAAHEAPASRHLAQRFPRTREVWSVWLLRAASLLTFESFQLNKAGQ